MTEPLAGPERQKGVSALIVLAALFACMGVFARYLDTGFTAYQQVYLRMLAALFLTIIFFFPKINWGKLKHIPKIDWLVLTLRAAAKFPIAIVLFTKAYASGKYSSVSFIEALPFVALWGVLLMKEKMTRQKFVLLLTAILGVALIAVKDFSNLLSWGRAESLIFVSTIFFSLSYVLRKKQTAYLNHVELAVLEFSLGLLFLIPLSLLSGEALPLANWKLSFLLVILVAGLFNTFNSLLTNYGFSRVPSILANNLLVLQPVFALAISILFYTEFPNAREIIGGLIIILSALGMNIVSRQTRQQ